MLPPAKWGVQLRNIVFRGCNGVDEDETMAQGNKDTKKVGETKKPAGVQKNPRTSNTSERGT